MVCKHVHVNQKASEWDSSYDVLHNDRACNCDK